MRVPSSAAELANHDAVLYGKTDGTTSLWTIPQNDGNSHVIHSEGRIIVGHSEAQVEAIKAGFGIAQCATWLVQDEVDRGGLVPILPDLSTDGLPLNLVWPIGRQLLPKVDAVLELLTADLRIR
ncbi:LysR substrate-binding domain-containing protein [Pseudomonas alliivorans]|nr:LysR substrate-binding domain-containing protein [Pseudomonas alliivorans]